MNDITTFNFQAREVRTVTDEYGEPQFVAKDVCDILGIEKYRDAIATLDEDERVSKPACPPASGNQRNRGGSAPCCWIPANATATAR